MPDASAFSPDYAAARARFRSSAMAAGARLEPHGIGKPGPDDEELTIDVAAWGSERPRRVVVVSSGIHGVEGFMGSASQAAVLEGKLASWKPADGQALVLVHAINPYGFAHLRRVNEDNIDLNRNFLRAGEAYTGCPERYPLLDGLLNPKSPPSSMDPFFLKAGLTIARHGMAALRDAVAGGQYEYPQGLFFGGSGPSRSQQILAEVLPRLLGAPERVVHVDFHTGLGTWADYKLLVDQERDSEGAIWLNERFGEDKVQPWDTGGVSYAIRGGLGTWCKATFPGTAYDVLVAEFGTYPVMRVITALRRENQAHQWGGPDHPATRWAKEVLRETFAPGERRWRDQVVERGVAIVDQAFAAAFD
jgi:hypothetical protein